MKTQLFASLALLAAVNVAFGTATPPPAPARPESAPPQTGREAATPALQLTPELINQFAEELASRHPSLLAARARTNAAAANIKSIRTWEDPMATVGAMRADHMMRREDGDVSYGVEQKLPLFGRPAAMRKMAGAELAVEVADEDMKFQTLRSELAKALFRAALADEMLAIAEQDLEWISVTTKVVEESYRSGTGRLMDVLTLQNEQSKRRAQLQTDRENRAQAVRGVNRLLQRDLATPWPTLRLPPLADEIPFSPSILGYALAQAPELRKRREELRLAEASVNVARKERWPEVSVGFENRLYARDNDVRSTEFMLGFSIPLGNSAKYRAAIRREEEKRRAVAFETQDLEQAVREEIHGLIVKIAAARREAVLYRDQIIPRSEQALASATAMFESGGMLRDVLEARRMWLEGKLMFTRAVAEQYEMLSELILCCGLGDLEALQMFTVSPDSTPKTSQP